MAIPITKKIQLSRVSSIDTPIIKKDLEPGIEAEANKEGTIYVDKDVDLNSKKGKEVVEHEMVHMDQMKRGDLDYDDENVYWKGKTYSRETMNEGSKQLPWEKEAYDKTE
mgnify:FL=1|tara:strand:- start:3756 stop:4085 length:330 start_codon:yes stop_codon:yes gene_type:complete